MSARSNRDKCGGGGGGRREQEDCTTAPDGAKVITAMLKELNVKEYDPIVVTQLLNYVHRYVSEVIDYAKKNAADVGKKSIDLELIKTALSAVDVESKPPTLNELVPVAASLNAKPLPDIPRQFGLPVDMRQCFSRPAYRYAPKPAQRPPPPVKTVASSISNNPKTISNRPDGNNNAPHMSFIVDLDQVMRDSIVANNLKRKSDNP